MRDTAIDPITISQDLEDSTAQARRLEVDERHRPGGVTAQQNPRPTAHPRHPRHVLWRG